jgi:beta-lactamase class A
MKRVLRAGVLLAAFLAVACTTARVPSVAARPAVSPIEAAVDSAVRLCACRVGVAARHLESNRSYERNATDRFEAASVAKIAVLTEAMAGVREGRIDLSERWTLTAANKASESGWLKLFDPGLNPTWNDMLTLMIGPSDNTATNAWIERLGLDRINARMESLGFREIRLLSILPWFDKTHPGPRWDGLKFGVVTPREVANWLSSVARGDLLDAESSRRIFQYLDTSPSRARLARRFSGEALWAGKTGTMAGVRNDAGILRTPKGRFVLVVFTAESPASSENAPNHPAAIAMGEIARAIVDEWSRDLPDLPGEPK